MKTLRLDPELEMRLQRAAAVTGESLSEFIRRAAAARADTLLRIGDRDDFTDVLGVVHGGGGQARRTGEALTDILANTAFRQVSWPRLSSRILAPAARRRCAPVVPEARPPRAR